MVILYCDKCGKRIQNAEILRRGIDEKQPPESIACEACAQKGAAMSVAAGMGSTAVLVAQRSEVLKPPKPVTGEAAAIVARPMDAPPQTARQRPATSIGLPKAQKPEAPAKPKKENTKLIAVFSAAGLLLIVLVVLLFGGSSKETQEAQTKNAPGAAAEKSAAKPALDVKNPVPLPVPAGPLLTPAQPKPPVQANPDALKPAEPAKLEEPPKPAPPAATDLAQITDPAVLREKIKDLGNKAPRDEVRRLSNLAGPDEPEKTIVAKFAKNNPDDIRSDYDSKVAMAEDKNEPAVKVTDGGDRLACYFRPGTPFTNRMRVNLRVFQVGLREMRLSIMVVNGIRYNIGFKAPTEGQWGDVTVDCSAAVADGVKLHNLAIQHIEVHGFRKGGKEGTFFELSKFDVVTGGQ
ncbi:MAG: hypothetical protein HY291_12210 [Planctomycetes bacterium]|nr:hypothetical protein [Planctomycetota bacterium]